MLLTREEFKKQVFARSDDKCILCGEPAEDAHHIIDRKLFINGGYFLDNGVAVCSTCHWFCERNEILPSVLRHLALIDNIILPEGFDPTFAYNKWGIVVGLVEEDEKRVLYKDGRVDCKYCGFERVTLKSETQCSRKPEELDKNMAM